MTTQEPISDDEVMLFSDVAGAFEDNGKLVAQTDAGRMAREVLAGMLEASGATVVLSRPVAKAAGTAALLTIEKTTGEDYTAITANITEQGCFTYTTEGGDFRVTDSFVSIARAALSGTRWDKQLSRQEADSIGRTIAGSQDAVRRAIAEATNPDDEQKPRSS